MGIVIADVGGTHTSITYGTNYTDRIPKNMPGLFRSNDRFEIVTGKVGAKPISFTPAEVTTPTHAEVLSAGEVDLTAGASGSVDSILVNGVELLSAPVAYNTSLTITGDDLETEINTNTTVPNYTANNVAGAVAIIAVADSGNTPNGFDVTSVATTITTVDSNFAGGISQADALETALHAILFE